MLPVLSDSVALTQFAVGALLGRDLTTLGWKRKYLEFLLGFYECGGVSCLPEL